MRALSRPPVNVVLVDTMIVIEAVDTGCWNAITGQLSIATSIECAEESCEGEGERPGPDTFRLRKETSCEPLCWTFPTKPESSSGFATRTHTAWTPVNAIC